MDWKMRRNPAADANWAAMDADILCSIFSRLPFVDLHRVKSICWGWNTAVDMFKSCSATLSFPELPWLIFPPLEDVEFTEGEKVGGFVNLAEEKTYPFNNLALKKMNGGCCYCIGSSHDWLICLDRKALPFLLNPFTSRRIDLPRFDLSLGVEVVHEIGYDSELEMVDGNLIARVKFVKKAILSSSPTLDRNYYLVIIYGFDFQLAFCKDGDTSWTKLEYNPNEQNADINFHGNQLYGIYIEEEDDGCVCLRVWDMNQRGILLVRKVNNILADVSCPPITSLLFISFYLVESLGNLLVVTRFVLHGDDTTSPKPESTGSSENHLDVGGYRTSEFSVFKLDMDQNLCTMVKSLCGFALFLGRNQSLSVDVRSCKMFKQDSIYFTDDYHDCDEGLEENIVNYSGYDWGVFGLNGDGFDRLSVNKVNGKSRPTWVSPLTKRLN